MSVQQPPPPAYGQPAYGQPVYGQPAYGQPAYGQPAYGPQPTSNVVVVTQPGAGMTARPGSCRHCGIGYPNTSFSIIGILLAICFFPLGIICCLMLQETRCTHCRALL